MVNDKETSQETEQEIEVLESKSPESCEEDTDEIIFDLNLEIDEKITISNSNEIEIFGTQEQRAEMFKDWALYFNEVTNPENTTQNNLFKAKYAPLNEVLNTVRPPFSKYGLTLIQTPYILDNQVCVKTIVTHKSGAVMSFPVTQAKLIKANNAVSEIQAFGSIVSYLRRFSVNSIAGVMGEIDNDGNMPNSKSKAETVKEDPELVEIRKDIVGLCSKLRKIQSQEYISKINLDITDCRNPMNIKDKTKAIKLKERLELELENSNNEIKS